MRVGHTTSLYQAGYVNAAPAKSLQSVFVFAARGGCTLAGTGTTGTVASSLGTSGSASGIGAGLASSDGLEKETASAWSEACA